MPPNLLAKKDTANKYLTAIAGFVKLLRFIFELKRIQINELLRSRITVGR
jgi:hypothetical protein